MKRTHFFLHGVTRPVRAPDMTRAKAARILRAWREALRHGSATRVRRVQRDGVHAYFIEWASEDVSGLYIAINAFGGGALWPAAAAQEPDLEDPYMREARFNLEAA